MVRFLSGVFFLSGAAALIFETLWFRQAGIAFGNSVWGAALVMAAFMTGLAAGNWGVARYGKSVARPIRIYAVLEIVIGVTGVALVFLLPKLALWLRPVFGPFLDRPYVLNPLRLGISFLLLVIPSTAMGATLPLLVRTLHRVQPNFGWALGRLYGWNTLGAVGGVLLTELALIRWLGIMGTGLVGLLFDLVAAFLAFRLSKDLTRWNVPAEGVIPSAESVSRLSGPARRILVAAFVFGATMLALEVVWFRSLLLVRDSSTLIFSIMLAVTLTGISLGGFVGSWWCRKKPVLHGYLPEISLVSGVVVVITYRCFELTYRGLQEWFVTKPLLVFVMVSFELVLPAALLSGLLFTLLGHALKGSIPEETRTAGLLTLANTTGAATGSLLGGFVLLPRLGMETSFFLLATVYGLGALVLLWNRASEKQWNTAILAPSLAGFLVCIAIFPFGLMETSFFRSIERRINVIDGEGSRIAAVREGLTETVFYMRHDRFGKPLFYRLVTNGFGMSATTTQAKRYMKMYVYWPVAVNPKAKSALLISYGVGSTAKALTDTKSLENIDIVDISRDILEMSSIVYADSGGHPLHDKRVNVHIEDGRFFLQTTDRHYDIITAEPPPPHHAGVVNLYSQEYFQLIRHRLAEGGITTYWLPNHLLKEGESLSIVKGFCNVFDDCSLWAGSSLSWMLVGTKNATGPGSRQAFARQWEDPVVGKELRALGFETPAQLGATFIADAPFLKRLLMAQDPLTDNFPQLISDHPPLPGQNTPALFSALMQEEGTRKRFEESEYIRRLWPGDLRSESISYFPFQRQINLVSGAPLPPTPTDYRWEYLHRSLTQTSLRTLVLWIFGSSVDEQRIIDQVRGEDPTVPEIVAGLASRAIADRQYRKAADYLAPWIPMVNAANKEWGYKVYLFALCMAGNLDAAEAVSAVYVADIPQASSDGRFWAWMNRTFGLPVPRSEGGSSIRGISPLPAPK